MISLYSLIAMNKAALGIYKTNLRCSEMLLAAGSVVDKRSRMINSAMQFPLAANYQELGRMVPEKVAAFGDAAEIMVDAWAQWQKAFTGQAHAAPKGACTFGKASSAYNWIDAVSRLCEAPGEAMMPLHKAATDNARRLRKVGWP
jgi:hypothetical protein